VAALGLPLGLASSSNALALAHVVLEGLDELDAAGRPRDLTPGRQFDRRARS